RLERVAETAGEIVGGGVRIAPLNDVDGRDVVGGLEPSELCEEGDERSGLVEGRAGGIFEVLIDFALRSAARGCADGGYGRACGALLLFGEGCAGDERAAADQDARDAGAPEGSHLTSVPRLLRRGLLRIMRRALPHGRASLSGACSVVL